MRIHLTPRFEAEFAAILDFIAEDSLTQAIQFEDAISAQIDQLADDSWARGTRKSFYVNEPNAHDLIYKGYVIPYLVNESKKQVELLGIFKHNLWRY